MASPLTAAGFWAISRRGVSKIFGTNTAKTSLSPAAAAVSPAAASPFSQSQGQPSFSSRSPSRSPFAVQGNPLATSPGFVVSLERIASAPVMSVGDTPERSEGGSAIVSPAPSEVGKCYLFCFMGLVLVLVGFVFVLSFVLVLFLFCSCFVFVLCICFFCLDSRS